MKTTLIILASISLLLLLSLLFLAYQSKSVPQLGLENGTLRQCPNTPNCVSSMANERPAAVEPLSFLSNPETAWLRLESQIIKIGGNVEKRAGSYLWATFSSPLLGFVDDMEVVMDKEKQLFHIRSASRVGRSDLSANRKRVEALRSLQSQSNQ